MDVPALGLTQERSTAARRGRLSNLLTGLLISGITLLVCLGGIELTGYLWEQSTAQGPLGWTLVAARRLHLVQHGTIGQPYYLLRPNEDFVWSGIPVHISSFGFRTEEFTLPKPAGVYRILNLGDSVAFGWAVNQADTYGKLLETRLNSLGDGRHYEVINAGIPGWGPKDERNFLLQEGLTYQPDAVVVDITLVNDIYGNDLALENQSGLFQWLRDNTYGWPFLTIEGRLLLSRVKGPEAIPVLNPPRNADAYYPLDEASPVYDTFWSFYQEMYAASQRSDIPFILVAFPTAFQVNSAAHPDIPQRVLRSRANAAGIPFVDLLPPYQQWCAMKGASPCEGYQNKLFADVWMHPSPVGHRLAAEQIYEALTQAIHKSAND
jgi:GDSL-like Lipase/Acylhydrolase family